MTLDCSRRVRGMPAQGEMAADGDVIGESLVPTWKGREFCSEHPDREKLEVTKRFIKSFRAGPIALTSTQLLL